MSRSAMHALYSRLRAQGFDRPFVRAAILPEWWEDALFDNDSNRLAAQMSIARFLGVRLQELVTDEAPIAPPIGNVRFKRNKGTEIPELTGAVTAALQAARSTAALLKEHVPFTGTRPALEIRQQLLARPDCRWPDLATLTDYCWQQGIGVIHLTRLPKQSKKITGLATFIGERPVIVLCSGRDSPAWLAFHLAHELGHIMCGHVKVGGAALVDVKFTDADSEKHEGEADRYAIELLTGHPQLQLTAESGLSSAELAQAAQTFGHENRIDPGTVALVYGYSKKHMPTAQSALTAINANSGARETLAAAFRRYVALDDLPDNIQRSLAATTQIYGVTAAAE